MIRSVIYSKNEIYPKCFTHASVNAFHKSGAVARIIKGLMRRPSNKNAIMFAQMAFLDFSA